MNLQEATAAWRADQAMLADRGIHLPEVVSYLPDEYKRNYTLALDAQPTVFSTPSAGVPAIFSTLIDPETIRIQFTPTRAAEIIGEVRKGTWLDSTMVFQVVEHTGEVSSYGDYSENGRAGINTAWPQRQSYLFQTIIEYGDRELELAGLARLSYAAELDNSAADIMNRFSNLSYFFGIQGMQNYGLVNDPSLSAAITPATKAYGHTQWSFAGAYATPNEIFADIQAMFGQMISQTGGLVDSDTQFVMVIPPGLNASLLTTNSFGLTVQDILGKGFPNLKIMTAVQYGVQSATNPQGIVGGNLIQLIATKVNGQDTCFCAFNEKMRAHTPVRGTSSYKKKMTSGTWGTVVRMPVAVVSMIGA